MVAVVNGEAYLFFGFLRPDLLVALCRLIGRRSNLEVATERLLHQQVKCRVNFSSIMVPSTILCPNPVMWIFTRSLGFTCYCR